MGKYKPKRKLSAGEKKLFNLQKKSTIQRGSDTFDTKGLIKRGDKFTKQTTRGTSKNSDAGYTTKPESTIEKPQTFTGRVDQTKGSPAPKRTTFKPENQFNSYNPLDEDRKTFDKYMKDARDKKAEDKLPLLRKATKVHKELPDEDKK